MKEIRSRLGHDIRSSMNRIVGMAQVLGYSELTPEQRECLDVIVASSRTLMAQVDQVLDLTAPPRREGAGPVGSCALTPGARELMGPRKLRLLLVDDQELNRLVMCKLLSRFGHRIETASGGGEALEKWDHGEFDVILMDVEMPGIDGTEATRRIRKAETGGKRHTPILALTAHAFVLHDDLIRSGGYDGYVPKPVEVSVLLEEMARCLNLRGAAPDKPARTVPFPVDREELARTLATLEGLLRQNDMSVLDRVGELRAHASHSETIDRLCRQIGEFDCAGALGTIENICEEYGIALSRP